MSQELVPLSELCNEIYRYPTYYDIKYVESGVPEIRGTLINDDGTLDVNEENWRFISATTSSKFPRTVLAEGDLVISVRGTIGKIGLVPRNLVGANMTANLIRVSPNRSKVYERYLWRFMRSPQFIAALDGISSSTTIKTLKAPDLKALKIPLPPIAEQNRIAAILDKAEELRGLRRKALGELDTIVQSIFLEMFGELTSVTEKNEYSLLTGCIKCKLGEQITLQRGFDITKDQCREGIYPVISSGGISAHHAEYKAFGPGVLLGRKGSVGRVHYIEEDYWPHDTTLWVKDFKGNIPIFVYYFFKRFPISDFEESTSNPTLNRNRLHPVNVFWPPLPLQQEFARRVEAIENLKATHRESLAQLDALFASLQHRAFRGEL